MSRRLESARFGVLLGSLGTLLLVGSAARAGAQPYIQFHLHKHVSDEAKAPAPPASSQKSTTIGSGNATISTAEAPSDMDMMWTEETDLGDGQVAHASVLWDDETKTLFASKTGTFTCLSGGTGTGNMLVSVYGNGNAAGKPAGSGWYLVDMNAGQCGVKAQGLYGCRFDADGNPTACGVAVLDKTTREVMIKTVTKGS
jgi:hypothetical protein